MDFSFTKQEELFLQMIREFAENLFLFAVGEETTILFTLRAPAHLRTAVEHADATTRNHDIELALLNVTTDVCCHDDELLALDVSVVVVG